MPWRRFLAYVRGLSPLSAFVNAITPHDAPTGPQNYVQSAPIIKDTQEGERAVLRLLGD